MMFRIKTFPSFTEVNMLRFQLQLTAIALLLVWVLIKTDIIIALIAVGIASALAGGVCYLASKKKPAQPDV